EGDLIAAGSIIIVDGAVSGDVLATAGIVVLNGDVLGDVRAFGMQVFINSGMIEGDLVTAGWTIDIDSEVQVTGLNLIDGGRVNTLASDNPRTFSDIENAAEGSLDGMMFAFVGFGLLFGTVVGILSALLFVGQYLAQLFVIKTFPVLSHS